MNKFKTLLAALLIATSVTACASDEPADTNVTVVEDVDGNVPSTTSEMNDADKGDEKQPN